MVFYNEDRSVFIQYRPIRDKAVVLYEPVGDPTKIEETLDQFLRFLKEKSLRPAFYQVGNQNMDMYFSRGFKFMKIGEDATLDLQTFSLSGKKL